MKVFTSEGPLAANPLLERTLPIPFHRIRPEHVVPGVRLLLAKAQAALDALPRHPEDPSWDNTLAPLDAVVQEVGETLAVVEHLLSVAETPALRDAYHQVLPEVASFWSRIPLNAPLWRRLRAYAETPQAGSLGGVRARHLRKTLQEFRRGGADLAPAARRRLEEIHRELAELEKRFSDHVLDATASWKLLVTDPARLEGIPPDALARFRQAARREGKEGWLLGLDEPSYQAVLKHARDRELREEVHSAYVSRCRGDAFDNVPLLGRILALRHELAVLLGYRDFADYRLEEAMAGSADRARAFLTDLIHKTRPYWERDLAELQEHARRLGIRTLRPWDVAFTAEDLRRRRYRFDEEALRPYFPLPKVLEGLFELSKRVFGLEVREFPQDAVWDPAVRTFELRNEEGILLGMFYTDWFPRPEKKPGAWMTGLRTGGPGPGGVFLPHLGAMVANFPPPSTEAPSLLSHGDVETLFHEFGHLLHQLASRVPIPARSGVKVAWDWVEVPSQLLENWAWEEEALALFASHFQTGEPLPPGLLKPMVAARRFQGGWRQMRQLAFAWLDLELHRLLAPSLSGESSGEEVLDFAEKILAPFSPDEVFARSHILTTFIHLFSGGYAAGYYSYLWSEMLEADAFTRFRREGVLSPRTGRAFVETILSQGDGEDPEQLFLAFMGRGPDPTAFLERNLGPAPGPARPTPPR